MAIQVKARGIGFRTASAFDGNRFEEFAFAVPRPARSDLLVKIEAVGANPVDLVQIRNTVGILPTPRIVGFDAAGTIIAKGPDAVLFEPGEHVFFAGTPNRQGFYATYGLVDERIVGHAPQNLPAVAAAGIPLAFLTSWETLVDKMGLAPTAANDHKTILIVNAAGGVGSIAVQLAKIFGLFVIATAGRPASAKWVAENGADAVLDHNRPLAPQLKQQGLPPVDYVFDLYGPDTRFTDFAELIAPLGKIVSIGQSRTALPLYLLKHKAASFAWEWMFAKPFYNLENLKTQHEALEEAAGLIEKGLLKPALAHTLKGLSTFSVQSALEALDRHDTIGKIAIEI